MELDTVNKCSRLRAISLNDIIPHNVVCSQELCDFFADNRGVTLKDAIRRWHWKKLQPGTHRYEKSDLDAWKVAESIASGICP